MKRRRHTPEQVIRKLREADRMLGEGKTVPEVAKALEVSEKTYHRWQRQYGVNDHRNSPAAITRIPRSVRGG